MMGKSVTIRGAVTWNSTERRSDRYGGIALQEKAVDVNNGETSPSIKLDAFRPFLGKQARLTATVIESNESCHIGDLFRGISPSKTPVGETIDLGTGLVAGIEELPDITSLLFCRKGQEFGKTDWMDPVQLYRLHDHVVDLTLEEVS